MLLKYVHRVVNGGKRGLGSEPINDSIGILLHISVGDVKAELLLELARYSLGRALNRNHLMSIRQYDRIGGCDRENTHLESSLILRIVP